jgi:hypothetical protein
MLRQEGFPINDLNPLELLDLRFLLELEEASFMETLTRQVN